VRVVLASTSHKLLSHPVRVRVCVCVCVCVCLCVCVCVAGGAGKGVLPLLLKSPNYCYLQRRKGRVNYNSPADSNIFAGSGNRGGDGDYN
jgi:hypothetical protein